MEAKRKPDESLIKAIPNQIGGQIQLWRNLIWKPNKDQIEIIEKI